VSYYVGVPVLLAVAIVEAAALPYFRLFDLQPNLMLVLLLAWIMVRGREEGLVLIPVGGLFLGLVDGAPLGAALIALAPLALLHELRGLHLGEGQLAFVLVFTAIATVLYDLVYLAVFSLQGQGGDWVGALLRVTLPSTALNTVVALPVYGLVYMFSADVRRGLYA
jgi:cell shape-determining protein MreD